MAISAAKAVSFSMLGCGTPEACPDTSLSAQIESLGVRSVTAKEISIAPLSKREWLCICVLDQMWLGPLESNKSKREHASAPFIRVYRCYRPRIYLLDPACMPSLASPSSRANFLPWKRAPARVVVPSLFCFSRAASLAEDWFRSTTFAGTLATTFFPCMMLTSTLGPVPSHCSLYSPALRLVPLMLVGLFKVRFALLAANALEASVKANPTTKLFVTVANFIAARFSSPKGRNWLGAARSRTTRENTCVSPRIAYNAAAGVERKGHKPAPP